MFCHGVPWLSAKDHRSLGNHGVALPTHDEVRPTVGSKAHSTVALGQLTLSLPLDGKLPPAEAELSHRSVAGAPKRSEVDRLLV